jgi:hypothetical protein
VTVCYASRRNRPSPLSLRLGCKGFEKATRHSWPRFSACALPTVPCSRESLSATRMKSWPWLRRHLPGSRISQERFPGLAACLQDLLEATWQVNRIEAGLRKCKSSTFSARELHGYIGAPGEWLRRYQATDSSQDGGFPGPLLEQ